MLKTSLIKTFISTLTLLVCFESQATEMVQSHRPTIAQIKHPSHEVNPRIESYLNIMNEHKATLGPLGSWQQGEIEIVLNPEQIKKIERQMKLRLISKGFKEAEAESCSEVGIIAEDHYWMWLRDPVIFPSGVYGTYNRLLWKNGIDRSPGVAVLPILPCKKIIVNLNYRHATRSWEIELPRGLKKDGETAEETAYRELLEETGYHLSKTLPIGVMAPDTGVLTSEVPLFLGEASHSGEIKRDLSEAISQNPVFSKQELKDAFVRGYIEVSIKGQLTKVNCRDPFLAFALLQAETRGLL